MIPAYEVVLSAEIIGAFTAVSVPLVGLFAEANRHAAIKAIAKPLATAVFNVLAKVVM